MQGMGWRRSQEKEKERRKEMGRGNLVRVLETLQGYNRMPSPPCQITKVVVVLEPRQLGGTRTPSNASRWRSESHRDTV